MPHFASFVLSFTACLTLPAWAAATRCPEHFTGGVAPTVTNPKLKSRTQEVCYQAYAVLHSGISRTPLYSAEHLTRSNVEAAQTLKRKDSFHPEPALPAEDRAELSDYARSNYDRGHMSPNGDMPDRFAQTQSYSLANMVPQVHANNAGIWQGIEGAARQLTLSEGEIYVVSGPAFIGNDLQRIGNVLVPTHFWKVLYSPAQQQAGAYLVTNDASRSYSTVTVSNLEKMVGISLLPAVPREVRDSGMALPKPVYRRGGGGNKRNSEPAKEFGLQDLSRILLDAIKRAERN
jgi:endonuclease G, mitochondrial